MRKLLFMAFAAIAFWGCGDASNDIEITDNTRNETEILWGSNGDRLWESPHFITEYVVPTSIINAIKLIVIIILFLFFIFILL